MKQFQKLNHEFRLHSPGHLSGDLVSAFVHRYRVGEAFIRGRFHWPEGAQLSLSPGRFALTLFRRDITSGFVAEVQRGEAEFALIIEPAVIVFAYRLGEKGDWSDVPFSWHLLPASAKIVPPIDCSARSRDLLWISLVGAEDGVIQAQRGMTLSPGFTFALRQAIRAQAMSSFDSNRCVAAISKLYNQTSSVAERLALASARTMGNE